MVVHRTSTRKVLAVTCRRKKNRIAWSTGRKSKGEFCRFGQQYYWSSCVDLARCLGTLKTAYWTNLSHFFSIQLLGVKLQQNNAAVTWCNFVPCEQRFFSTLYSPRKRGRVEKKLCSLGSNFVHIVHYRNVWEVWATILLVTDWGGHACTAIFAGNIAHNAGPCAQDVLVITITTNQTVLLNLTAVQRTWEAKGKVYKTRRSCWSSWILCQSV